jgi:hypothetical protein
MEAIILYLSAAMVIGTAVTVLVGVSINDIAMIIKEKEYRRHPHAKRWRNRPLVSVIIPSDITDQTIKSITQNGYRKIELIHNDAHSPKGQLVLKISRDMILKKGVIRAAVHQFNGRPRLQRIELETTLSRPNTVRGFFAIYLQVIRSMFLKSRAGLGVYPKQSVYPTIIRSDIPPHWTTRLYQACSIASAFIAPAGFAYVYYIGFVLHQPDILMVALAVGSAFMVFVLWWNDQLSFKQKLTYMLLLPATIGFFIIAAFWRPLKMLANVTKAKVPIRIGLFVRIKDILRIVKLLDFFHIAKH